MTIREQIYRAMNKKTEPTPEPYSYSGPTTITSPIEVLKARLRSVTEELSWSEPQSQRQMEHYLQMEAQIKALKAEQEALTDAIAKLEA